MRVLKKELLYKQSSLEIFTFKKLRSVISKNSSLRANCFSILLVNSGNLTILVNEIEYVLYAKDFFVVPLTASFKILHMEKEIKGTLISFTSEFLFKNSIRKPNIGFFEIFILNAPTKAVLKDDQVSMFSDLFILLRKMKYKINHHAFYDDIQLLSFNLLLYLIAGLFDKNPYDVRVKYTKKEKLVFRFLEILDLNCTKQHGVKFYSDALFISSGHLGKIVKQVTNKTIKQLIKEAVLLEAKILLQNDDLTILQIIEELHFSNSSSFSSFFKKSTSMSPTEYRLKLKFECKY